MAPTSPNDQEFHQLISNLNHKVTGSLARLEGLYLLYKKEGNLRDDLWEKAFQQARQETQRLLMQSFALSQSPQQKTPLQVA